MINFHNQKTNETGSVLTNCERTLTNGFCLICRKNVELLSHSQAGYILKKNLPDLNQFTKSGKLHLLHNISGSVMLCADSVNEVFQNMSTQPLDPNIFITNPSSERIFITNPSYETNIQATL